VCLKGLLSVKAAVWNIYRLQIVYSSSRGFGLFYCAEDFGWNIFPGLTKLNLAACLGIIIFFTVSLLFFNLTLPLEAKLIGS